MNPLTTTTDVTIIGGGIMGLATAYHLTKMGYKVVLVEQDKIAAGASGSNAGMIRKGDPIDPLDHRIYKGSYEMYRDWDRTEALGLDIELKEITILRCFTDEHIERMKSGIWKKRLETWKKDGLSLRQRDQWELSEPHLAEHITWGIETTAPMINLFRVCRGLAHTATQNGAEVHTYTKAVNIKCKNDRIDRVITNRGDIETRYVVNAAGAWAPHIGKMVGLDIPILPALGTGLVTEPIPPLTTHERLLYEPVWYDPHQPFIADSLDPCQRLGITTEVDRHTREENYIIARSEHLVTLPQQSAKIQPEPETVKCIAESAIQIIPKLAEINIIRVYAGMRPVCEVDGKPILGHVEDVKGFVLATGPWHTGMSYGPMCGKLVAEVITEKTTSIPIDELKLTRFTEQDHFPYVHHFRYH